MSNEQIVPAHYHINEVSIYTALRAIRPEYRRWLAYMWLRWGGDEQGHDDRMTEAVQIMREAEAGYGLAEEEQDAQ